jgi:hypothetical protein
MSPKRGCARDSVALSVRRGRVLVQCVKARERQVLVQYAGQSRVLAITPSEPWCRAIPSRRVSF